MEKHLHIVCLDVPYPVDYGGVFDIFWKIRALHAHGIKLHLHCFEYGRGIQPELENYAEAVHYYPRNGGHKGVSTSIPYIVASRASGELISNLLHDDHPVLLEGVHCTYPLLSGELNGRKTVLRLHNVEYQYYRQLFRHESSLIRKLYFFNESRLLKCYEKKIANLAEVMTVSTKDADTYREQFGAARISYLPVFLPFQHIRSMTGMGTYCLYHGNLAVAENEKAAIWLLETVFSHLKIPFVIAGKNPGSRLRRLVSSHCCTCLIANPGQEEMEDLIAKAQVNILPSFNETGIKLKLLNALFNGRHCIVNEAAVYQTGLHAACTIADSPESFREAVHELYHYPFGDKEIRLRKELLQSTYDNDTNAATLIQSLW